MQTLWIRFIYPDDIFIIDPFYDLGNDLPKICSICGNTLHLPVKYNEKMIEINQTMGDIHVPFPIEQPNFIIRNEPELPTLLYLIDTLSYEQQDQLKNQNKGSILLIENNRVELQIYGFSCNPIYDCLICNPVKERNNCEIP